MERSDATPIWKTRSLEGAIYEASSHPLRVRILEVLLQIEATPERLAVELDEDIHAVREHLERLVELGLAECHDGRKHRAAARVLLREEELVDFPAAAQRAIVHQQLRRIFAHVKSAVADGGFDRPDIHLSWTALRLDEEAYARLASTLDEVLQSALALQAEAEQRLDPDDEGIPSEVAMLHFVRGHERAPRDVPIDTPLADREPKQQCGGTAARLAEWEARAQVDVGVMIDRYLAEHPPPAASRGHDLLALWARRLRRAGRARLRAQGASRLRRVG